MFRITRDVFHPVFYPRYTDIFPGHVDVLNFGSVYPMHCDFPFISTNIFSRCNGNSVATIGSGGTSGLDTNTSVKIIVTCGQAEIQVYQEKGTKILLIKIFTNIYPNSKKTSIPVNKQRKRILVYC